MEAEVRQILETTLAEPDGTPEPNLAEAIRRRFAPLGEVDLELPAGLPAAASPSTIPGRPRDRPAQKSTYAPRACFFARAGRSGGAPPGAWRVAMKAEPPPVAFARSHLMTGAEFHWPADVSLAVEWFANLTNPSTMQAYENAVRDCMRFAGISRPEEFRIVTRAHVIRRRQEFTRRGLGGSPIRHRLSSLT